jgi:hypothetical protein
MWWFTMAGGSRKTLRASQACSMSSLGRAFEMPKITLLSLYGVAMAAIIVGVDFAFFRNRFWERLAVNIGIVLMFAAFYLRFLRH